MSRDSSLSAWRARFKSLKMPSTEPASGFWKASFVGPFWLTRSAPTAICLGGLPGWRGKRFISKASAINVLASGEERLPMEIAEMLSLLDCQPALVCTYGAESSWPWRFVRDEFRELSPTSWLGMTIIDLPGIRRLGWPFILNQE